MKTLVIFLNDGQSLHLSARIALRYVSFSMQCVLLGIIVSSMRTPNFFCSAPFIQSQQTTQPAFVLSSLS